jgi:hypothetical protein
MSTRLGVLLLFVGLGPLHAADNELTEAERKEGYVLLFNGQDLTSFREDPKRQFNKWFVQDGVISLTRAATPKDVSFTPLPLWTIQDFDDYVLKVDCHTGPDPENGHSSIILRSAARPGIYPQPGLEVSIFGPARRLGHFCTGAFRYQIQAPTKALMKPAGEWNSFVITVAKKRIEVELNGVLVNQVDLASWTEQGKRPDGSPYPLPLALTDLPAKGPIGFRDDYGIPVWYKNLKVKPLAPETSR